MALVTTVGGATSDSYITLAEYTTYATNRGWTLAATDDENEQDLRRAADFIDRNYQFVGTQQYQTQSRSWPRLTNVLVDGWPIDPDTVPQDVKDAQAELAYLLNGGLDPAATISGVVAATRAKAGPVETETEYLGGLGRPRLVAIEGLLRDYLTVGQGQVRLARA